MNIKTEAVVSFKNDDPRIQVKKEEEEEEEEDRDNDDHNSNNYDGTATDTAGKKSCGFEQVKVKKEEEEKEDDGNNNNNDNHPAEINNCSNRRKNGDDDDEYYTDWTSGDWGWLLPTSTTTCSYANANANANDTAIQSATPSSRSSSSSSSTSISISRKRTAASRSRNTTSIIKEDTPKSKKTRLLPPPPPSPSNNRRHATTVKQEEEEEDSVCYNDEVNNKANDDNDNDDDGYESWTEGNWCLILPTGSSSTHTRTANTEYTKKQNKNWNKMFHRLISYKNQHNGSTLVPCKYEADSQLGRWVRWQRHNYSIKMISVHRIERLESIGFVWNGANARVLDGKWMETYDQLVAYKKQHKSTQVPQTYTGENNDIHLGLWVNIQRTAYNRGKLLEKRKDLLNSIDFAWKGKSGPR